MNSKLLFQIFFWGDFDGAPTTPSVVLAPGSDCNPYEYAEVQVPCFELVSNMFTDGGLICNALDRSSPSRQEIGRVELTASLSLLVCDAERNGVAVPSACDAFRLGPGFSISGKSSEAQSACRNAIFEDLSLGARYQDLSMKPEACKLKMKEIREWKTEISAEAVEAALTVMSEIIDTDLEKSIQHGNALDRTSIAITNVNAEADVVGGKVSQIGNVVEEINSTLTDVSATASSLSGTLEGVREGILNGLQDHMTGFLSMLEEQTNGILSRFEQRLQVAWIEFLAALNEKAVQWLREQLAAFDSSLREFWASVMPNLVLKYSTTILTILTSVLAIYWLRKSHPDVVRKRAFCVCAAYAVFLGRPEGYLAQACAASVYITGLRHILRGIILATMFVALAISSVLYLGWSDPVVRVTATIATLVVCSRLPMNPQQGLRRFFRRKVTTIEVQEPANPEPIPRRVQQPSGIHQLNQVRPTSGRNRSDSFSGQGKPLGGDRVAASRLLEPRG